MSSHVRQLAEGYGMRFGIIGSEHYFKALLELHCGEVCDALHINQKELADVTKTIKSFPTFHKARKSTVLFSPSYQRLIHTAHALQKHENALFEKMKQQLEEQEEETKDGGDDQGQSQETCPQQNKSNNDDDDDASVLPISREKSEELQEEVVPTCANMINALLLVGAEQDMIVFLHLVPRSRNDIQQYLHERRRCCSLVKAPPMAESSEGTPLHYLPPIGAVEATDNELQFGCECVTSKAVASKKRLQLPELPSFRPNMCKTKLPNTHWVVPGRVMCGSSPLYWYNQQESLTTLIRDHGVNMFVSLQMEASPKRYRQTIEHTILPSLQDRKDDAVIRFLHCKIEDFGILDWKSATTLVERLAHHIVMDGYVLYIHCAGGHGRTGTIVTMLISLLYGHNTKDALFTLKMLHHSRTECTGRHCSLNMGELETQEQEQQASMLETMHKRGHYKMMKK